MFSIILTIKKTYDHLSNLGFLAYPQANNIQSFTYITTCNEHPSIKRNIRLNDQDSLYFIDYYKIDYYKTFTSKDNII
jgi:hypothetical protein